MDLESTLNSQNGSAPAPASAPPPRPGRGQDVEIEGIKEHGSLNVASLLFWLSAVVAITATVYLWFLNSSAAQNLTDQKSQRDAVVAEITSPTYVNVEARATAFQAAVKQLTTAEKSQYLMSSFLPLFYGRLDKNVIVTNLAVDSSGKISFNGTTDSYKSAALQLASLKGWTINSKNVVTNPQLLSESEDVSKGVVVTFAISGTVDKTVSLVTAPTNATTGGSTQSTSSGQASSPQAGSTSSASSPQGGN